jgi:hypothetical protein
MPAAGMSLAKILATTTCNLVTVARTIKGLVGLIIPLKIRDNIEKKKESVGLILLKMLDSPELRKELVDLIPHKTA